MGGPAGPSSSTTAMMHSTTVFSAFVFALALALYINTLQGGYVWDDRAAIIANKDVQGLTPWSDLLKHDFWGQDIRLIDSHKSFRPVTVASFRLNHNVHGYNAAGFHALNVVIHAVGTVVFYWLAGQWVNDRVARVAALVFCCHPVHVEAVASLVGRADSLCGAFYLLAVYLYTSSIRRSSSHSRSAVWPLLTLALAFVAALGASFSKEIGITVYGVFAALEVCFVLLFLFLLLASCLLPSLIITNHFSSPFKGPRTAQDRGGVGPARGQRAAHRGGAAPRHAGTVPPLPSTHLPPRQQHNNTTFTLPLPT
jgi:hypothetical protein